MQNSIIFGGVNSADYGIYISGEGVFDAPKRAVEMVTVPGRNGEIAVDQGYFENITVTYPAFNKEDNMTDFCQALSDFRNAICSQVGYQRLTDTFHTDEYRMAVYVDGLEVEPIKYNTASKFDIKFNCKPQRFLTSGEAEVSVSSGDTLANPTQFESQPLIEAEGYGNITVGDKTISLMNKVYGDIELNPSVEPTDTYAYNSYLVSSGDSVKFSKTRVVFVVYNAFWTALFDEIANIVSNADNTEITTDGQYITITLDYPDISTTTATVSTLQSVSVSCEAVCGSARMKLTIAGSIKGTATGVSLTASASTTTVSGYSSYSFSAQFKQKTMQFGSVTAKSTASILGHPTYIDCEIGEAYKIENDELISLNAYISLGSDLPVLGVGSTEITYDGAITSLKVVPRWWRI